MAGIFMKLEINPTTNPELFTKVKLGEVLIESDCYFAKSSGWYTTGSAGEKVLETDAYDYYRYIEARHSQTPKTYTESKKARFTRVKR
jgi:hypothetical protein